MTFIGVGSVDFIAVMALRAWWCTQGTRRWGQAGIGSAGGAGWPRWYQKATLL